jgi:hypothetical protein
MRIFISNLFILLLLNTTILAQSKSLQFKQVKLVTNTTEVVPVNHVWKVVGIFTDVLTTGNFSDSNTPAIIVNGAKNYYMVPMPIGSGINFAITPVGFPIWFPAGTSIAASNKVKYINVIEFEIVQ